MTPPSLPPPAFSSPPVHSNIHAAFRSQFISISWQTPPFSFARNNSFWLEGEGRRRRREGGGGDLSTTNFGNRVGNTYANPSGEKPAI